MRGPSLRLGHPAPRFGTRSSRRLGGLALLGAMTCMGMAGCWANQARWQRDSEIDGVTRKDGESEAEAMYRAGVTCMDVHERDDCAIEYFEKIVERNPKDRAIAGDSMFRLIELYRRAGREEDATMLMRKFWDVGTDRKQTGNLPYPARWLPKDLDTVFSVDLGRFADSGLSRSLSEDALDSLFTCDPERRKQLEDEREARRAAKLEAKLAAMSPEEREAYEAERAEREAEREARRQAREEKEPEGEPTYDVGSCELARALGFKDLREWTRLTSALNVFQPERSAAIFGVPRVETHLAAAVEAGRLIAPEAGAEIAIYTLPPFEPAAGEGDSNRPGPDDAGAKKQRYEDFRVAVLDLDTLVLARAEVLDEVIANKAAGEITFSPSGRALAERVPKDVTFFTIMSPEAMKRGMAGAGALASLLPEPEGMLFAAVTYDYAGLFVRIPTSNPLKAALLLSLVKTALDATEDERDAEDDPGLRAIEKLDVSQTPDGGALQMTTVLTPEDINAILRD